MKSLRSGQTLVELLIAIVVGIIFLAGISMIISSSLSETGQAAKVQIAATNAQDLLDNVRVWSVGSWSNLSSLATGSSYQYYLITSSSPYTVTSGIETLIEATTTYYRYFYLSDVYRTSSGAVTSSASGNTYDPSTKQLSVGYNWFNGVTSTMTTYLTRNQEVGIDQTDWSGGVSSTAVVTSVNNLFASSSNIDYSTSTGSIYVSIPGY